MASECSDVAEDGVLGEGAHVGCRGDECADGHAAAHAFGDQHNVGCNAVFLEGEEYASASEASLNLVEYEEGASLGAAVAELLEVVAKWWSDTPLCLHRLDDYASGALRYLVEAVGAVVLDVADLWQQWSERCGEGVVAHKADGTLGTAMVGLAAGDDFAAASDALG